MVRSLELLDDGLYIEDVGKWAKEKYKHIGYYADLFSTGMKNKWDCLVYIDLFSGSGLAKIRKTEKIVPASPLLALNVKNQFDRYIFCEIDTGKIDALKKRVNNIFSAADVYFLDGDVNDNVNAICNLIPKASKKLRVLSFCVVDPYNIGSLKFLTIERISKSFVDFLVLIPSGMDANRNEKVYVDPSHSYVECFLGDPCWRDRLKHKSPESSFGDFIVDSFSDKMQTLGYRPPARDQMPCVRNPYNQSPLYHLALYSRDKLGVQFWKEARKYSDPQLKLPLEM